MPEPIDGYEFRPLDLRSAGAEALAAVSALTGRREEEEVDYLLADPDDCSRSFGVYDGDRLTAFQAFVYKPLLVRGAAVHSFRSEFTIALPQLRGTGLFPRFYRWAVREIREEFDPQRTYIWGETAHRGFLKYGFRIWKRYRYYQVRSQNDRPYGELAHLMGRPYRRVAVVARAVPLPRRHGEGIERTASLPFERYRGFLGAASPVRSRLAYAEAGFRRRFEANPFYEYEFWRAERALVVVRVDDGWATISDVLASSPADYLAVLTEIIAAHPRCVVHGNIMSETRAPYFWLNLRLGFVPFVGGGSFVEDNRTCASVRLADLPLYESYGFGVPATPAEGEAAS